jgi:hypothetical protein
MKLRSRTIIIAGSVLAVSLVCFAAKEFSMPKAKPAAGYPAHDYHSNEKVTVAVDPYNTPAKTSIFVVPYRDLDLLPVFLVVTNDSDTPVVLTDIKAQLVAGDGTKLNPASEDDVYRKVSHPRAAGARVPLPFPTKRVKGGVDTKEWSEIQSAQFKAKAVEPRSSQAGFLFFDVSDVPNPLPGAHFYLTGVRDSSGNDLMYFEVPLDKYLEAQKP